MARKKSGGFNRVLNFIGLVDDEDPRDTYGDEYQSDQYGRQDAYAPQRSVSRARAPQQAIAPRRTGYEPTRAPRMNRTAYSGRFDEPRATAPARTANRTAERGYASGRGTGYDYSPRTNASRFGSYDERGGRFDEAPRGEQNLPQVRGGRGDARARTVMYSLHSLEECCEVIDNLIRNNTVILTMDELDVGTLQRAVDTLSGAVFALHATIRKASDRTYLIAPQTVEVNDTYEMDRRF